MTLGMWFLAAALVYSLLTIGAMVLFGAASKQLGISPAYGILFGFVGMIALVFWDAIPTQVAHSRYCSKEYGFRVFKTLDQWKLENPGVAETLTPNAETSMKSIENYQSMHLNGRFDWERRYEPVFLSVLRTKAQVVDTTTAQVMAEFVDFRSGRGPIETDDGGWIAMKIWLYQPGCFPAGSKSDGLEMNKFSASVRRMGEAQ